MHCAFLCSVMKVQKCRASNDTNDHQVSFVLTSSFCLLKPLFYFTHPHILQWLSGMAWGRMVVAVVLGEEGWVFNDKCSVKDAIFP